MKVIESIAASAAGIAAIRRDIHAHPELCFEEVRTADVVAARLTEWGIPIHRGLGRTGVVGITTVVPTTTELAQKLSASSSVSHNGSGTRASITCLP